MSIDEGGGGPGHGDRASTGSASAPEESGAEKTDDPADVSLTPAPPRDEEPAPEEGGPHDPKQAITQDNIAKLSYADIVERAKIAEGIEKAQLELAQAKMELWQLNEYDKYLDGQVTAYRDDSSDTGKARTEGLQFRKNNTVWARAKKQEAVAEAKLKLGSAAEWTLPATTPEIFGFNSTKPITADAVIKLTPAQIEQRLVELNKKDFDNPELKSATKVLTPAEEKEKLQLDLWQAEIAKRNLVATASDADKKAANDKVEAAKAEVTRSGDTPWDFSKYVPPKVASTGPSGTVKAGQPLKFEDKSSNPWELQSKYVLGQMFEALAKFLISMGGQFVFEYAGARPFSGAYSALAGMGLLAGGGAMKIGAVLVNGASRGKYQFPLTNQTADAWIAKSEKYTGTWALMYDAVAMGMGIKEKNGYVLWEHAKNHDLVKLAQIIVPVATLGLVRLGLSDGLKFTKKDLYSYCAKTVSPNDPTNSWFGSKNNIVLWQEEADERAGGGKNNPGFGSIPTKQQFAWWGAFVLGAPIVLGVGVPLTVAAGVIASPFVLAVQGVKAIKDLVTNKKATGDVPEADAAAPGRRGSSASTDDSPENANDANDAQIRMRRSGSVSSAPEDAATNNSEQRPGQGPTLRAEMDRTQPTQNQQQDTQDHPHTMNVRESSSGAPEDPINTTNSISASSISARLVALAQKVSDAFANSEKTLAQRLTAPFRAIGSFLNSFNIFRASDNHSFRNEREKIEARRQEEQARRRNSNSGGLGGSTDSNQRDNPEEDRDPTTRRRDSTPSNDTDDDNPRRPGPSPGGPPGAPS